MFSFKHATQYGGDCQWKFQPIPTWFGAISKNIGGQPWLLLVKSMTMMVWLVIEVSCSLFINHYVGWFVQKPSGFLLVINLSANQHDWLQTHHESWITHCWLVCCLWPQSGHSVLTSFDVINHLTALVWSNLTIVFSCQQSIMVTIGGSGL